MQAVLLAAGLSTRLRPLTDNLPKPMLPVLGAPMIEHVVRQLASAGFSEIIITTHFCAETIRNHFGSGARFDVHIEYAHEPVLMNTAGSLKRIEPMIRDDFLIIGGNDLLPTIDLHAFARRHFECGGIGTIAFKQLSDPALLSNFGQGVLDDDDRLVAFKEKPTHLLSDLIHTTYQIYSPRALRLIPEGIPCSIPEFLIHRMLASGERLYGYRTTSPFICVSTKDQYATAAHQLAEALNINTEGLLS